MLPTNHRLRNSDEFRAVVRRGVRAGRTTLVVHALRTACPESRAGFVVSKAVGNAVTRNRVKRQLRHLVAAVLPETTPNVDVVVRALPSAAHHPIADDFAEAWASALAKAAS